MQASMADSKFSVIKNILAESRSPAKMAALLLENVMTPKNPFNSNTPWF